MSHTSDPEIRLKPGENCPALPSGYTYHISYSNYLAFGGDDVRRGWAVTIRQHPFAGSYLRWVARTVVTQPISVSTGDPAAVHAAASAAHETLMAQLTASDFDRALWRASRSKR